MEFSILEIALLVIGLYLMFTVMTLNEKLKNIQMTVNQMAKSLDLPEHPINDELRTLIAKHEDIQAIKLARETLGLSLLEGKQYIDKLKSEL